MANDIQKSILYTKQMNKAQFDFELLTAPSMYNWFSQFDIDSIYNIATSVKYASNIDLKKKTIDDIMKKRGCRKIGGGTNRVVYAPYECRVNCFKIGLDSIGMRDNPAENYNQTLLKPFVTKMFEHDPSGIIANVERVNPIRSRYEYESIAEDIFDLLANNIIGRYVLEDIGTNYMFNYGIRDGFGAVLLDYPMVFEIDGSKLFCNNKDMYGTICGGVIDYDIGFNHLYCTTCGKKYQARRLTSEINNNTIKIHKEDIDMPIVSQLIINGKVVAETDATTETIKANEEVKGIIRTRKVRMTPKEVEKMKKDQQRKVNESKLKDMEQRMSRPVGVMEDRTPNTIGSVLESNRQPKYDYHSNGDITEETKEDEVLVDTKVIQSAMLSALQDDTPDYNKYGLEEDNNDEPDDEEELESKYSEYEDKDYKRYEKFDKSQKMIKKLGNL